MSENPENTAAEAPATEGAEKAKKVRTAEPKRYFLGGKYARPETVFGFIKGVVARAGSEGMMSDQIIDTVLAEFKPKKSQQFDRNYVQAYLRDCPKFGYLTMNADEAAADLGEAPAKAEKPKKAEGEPTVTKAGQEFLDELKTFFAADGSNRDTKSVSVKDVADGLKKTAKALAKVASKLEKDGFVTTKVDGEDTLVAFTDAGWAVAKDAPEEAEPAPEGSTEE